MSREDFPSAILLPAGMGLWVGMLRHTKGGWATTWTCQVRR